MISLKKKKYWCCEWIVNCFCEDVIDEKLL